MLLYLCNIVDILWITRARVRQFAARHNVAGAQVSNCARAQTTGLHPPFLHKHALFFLLASLRLSKTRKIVLIML